MVGGEIVILAQFAVADRMLGGEEPRRAADRAHLFEGIDRLE